MKASYTLSSGYSIFVGPIDAAASPQCLAGSDLSHRSSAAGRQRGMRQAVDVGPDELIEAAKYAEAIGFVTQPGGQQIPLHEGRRNVT